MSVEKFWTASDGTKLFYRYDDFTDPWKKAPLVVLLHPGLGSSLRLFGWVPHLARDYRVVRPDIRGHGKSEPGSESGLTHERLARDLTELLDHLEVKQAHVMGSSAGGMIAAQTALRYPERFLSLALYAATAGIPPSRHQKGDWLGRVTRDGVRIAYYIDDFTDPWKTPATLLMLHSAMSSSRRFYSMVPGLARHYRVVRMDSRGHGNSQVPPPEVPHNKERITQDVLELLAALGTDRVHILGGSAGGYTAQLLAIHHPECCVADALAFLKRHFPQEQNGTCRSLPKCTSSPQATG